MDKMYLEVHLKLIDLETNATPRDGDMVGKYRLVPLNVARKLLCFFSKGP